MVFCPLTCGLPGIKPQIIDVFVEDKRPLCQLSSKRLEDNWHSGLLSYTKQRLYGVRLPVGRKWLTLRQSGERLPESRCFEEDKRPLCQLSSKRLEDNWHSGLLSSAKQRLPEKALHLLARRINWHSDLVVVEDKRPLCQLSSKRLEDNWHSLSA